MPAFFTRRKTEGEDERHLAPAWLKFVRVLQPPVIFGEQVANAVTKDEWLDDLLDALEAEGYATGAVVLPACGVGAPHIRQRLWFTGVRLADSDDTRLEGWCGAGECADQQSAGSPGMADHWRNDRWLYCRDGKFRPAPTEPALFPLADGVPNRVGLLRGAGNAIVPQVAAEIIGSVKEWSEFYVD
ncbi:DNA cytosine methyltransferase [Candidatus Parcubacteria bacterium]|nr:MAG: DNA cytosine methyltransferase [Candidatus Parcubacteria bacterium]